MPSRITRIAQQVADVCQASGTAYTVVQLGDCVVALIKLASLSADEAQVHALFAQLVTDSARGDHSWDWIIAELYFEMNVLLMGDRATARLRWLYRGEPS